MIIENLVTINDIIRPTDTYTVYSPDGRHHVSLVSYWLLNKVDGSWQGSQSWEVFLDYIPLGKLEQGILTPYEYQYNRIKAEQKKLIRKALLSFSQMPEQRTAFIKFNNTDFFVGNKAIEYFRKIYRKLNLARKFELARIYAENNRVNLENVCIFSEPPLSRLTGISLPGECLVNTYMTNKPLILPEIESYFLPPLDTTYPEMRITKKHRVKKKNKKSKDKTPQVFSVDGSKSLASLKTELEKLQ